MIHSENQKKSQNFWKNVLQYRRNDVFELEQRWKIRRTANIEMADLLESTLETVFYNILPSCL